MFLIAVQCFFFRLSLSQLRKEANAFCLDFAKLSAKADSGRKENGFKIRHLTQEISFSIFLAMPKINIKSHDTVPCGMWFNEQIN